MSISESLKSIKNKISGIKDGIVAAYEAIASRNGDWQEDKTLANLPAAIRRCIINNGAIQNEPLNDDTIFVDVDGTILYKLSPAEVMELTEMPPAPVRDGLTFRGWTHTLEEIQDGEWHDVGALYNSDEWRIHFSIEEDDTEIKLSTAHNSYDTLTIEWGDGTFETVGNTVSHIYKKGEFDCRITTDNIARGWAVNPLENSAKYITGLLVTPRKVVGSCNFKNCNAIGVVFSESTEEYIILDNSKIITYNRDRDALSSANIPFNCYNLRYFCTPIIFDSLWSAGGLFNNSSNNLRSIDFGQASLLYGPTFRSIERVKYPTPLTRATQHTYNHSLLKKLKVSYSESVAPTIKEFMFKFQDCIFFEELDFDFSYVTTLQSNAFQNSGIKRLYAPALTSIAGTCFYNCKNLTEFTSPNTCTKINTLAFYSCTNLTTFYVKRSVVTDGNITTLAGTNAFDSVHADFKIYVPADSVDAYKAATNWSTYADKIFAEPETTE